MEAILLPCTSNLHTVPAMYALGTTIVYSVAVLGKHALLTKTPSFFTLHPILSCGLLVLVTYGISRSQSIRGPHTYDQRTQKANNHAYTMVAAAALLGGTFAAVYYHKEQQGRPHNTTFHEKIGLFTLIVFMVQSGRAASGYTSERGTFYSNIHKHRNGGYFIALCVYAVHAAAVVEGRTGYKLLGSQAALLALLLSAAVLLLNGAKRKGTKSIPTYDIDGKESSGTNLITTLTANATARQSALVENLKND